MITIYPKIKLIFERSSILVLVVTNFFTLTATNQVTGNVIFVFGALSP